MTRRLVGLDLARALAVFGMVLVNFKVVMGLGGGGSGGDGPAWLSTAVALFEGRAAATFVVLAGVGISLLSNRARNAGDQIELKRVRRTLRRRALVLFAAGLAYTPLWPADILHFYGVYIALATLMLGQSSRRLAAAAGLLVVGFVGLVLVLDYERGWDFESLAYADLWTAAGMLRHLFFNGFHPVVPWLAFLLVGMILGRLELRDRAVRRRVLVLGASVGLAAELASRLLSRVAEQLADPSSAGDVLALIGTEPMPPMPLYMLAGAGTATAVITLCVSAGERWGAARWMQPAVATGQLALTLYVAHVVIGMGVLELLGLLEGRSLSFAVAAACVFCGVGAAASSWWRRRIGRGPLEALLRRVTG